jgi:hypothetical protein
MKALPVFIVLVFAIFSPSVMADTVKARCDIYPRGSDHASKMLPCSFSQRQGYVTIRRDDGVTHELSPSGDVPGNFSDARGRAAYRNSGLGDQGQIYRLHDETVYVYWSTAALHPDDNNNATAPFSTKDYDATTLLRCRAVDDANFARCPAGILRMQGGQASIVIQNQKGEQFTINFMKDYINATNRQVDARFENDTWIVTIDGKELYEVPLAAIEGG